MQACPFRTPDGVLPDVPTGRDASLLEERTPGTRIDAIIPARDESETVGAVVHEVIGEMAFAAATMLVSTPYTAP